MEKAPTFQASAITSWPTHKSRNPDKAHKRRLSIARQLRAGANIDDVRTKIRGLYRQSSDYMGRDGSYNDFLKSLGFGESVEDNNSVRTNGHLVQEGEMMTDEGYIDYVSRADELLDILEQTYPRTKII